MPKTVPFGGRFTILGTWTNLRQIANIFEAEVEGTLAANRTQTLTQYAEVLSDAWVTFVLPRMPNNYSHQIVEFVDLNSATGPTGLFSQPTATSGARVDPSTPPDQCRLVHKNLTGSARGSRAGRTYLSGIIESDVSEDGGILLAEQTLTNTAMANFLTAVTITVATGSIESAALAVVQWPSLTVPQPPKKVTDPDGVGEAVPILSLTIDPILGSQRRRVRP